MPQVTTTADEMTTTAGLIATALGPGWTVQPLDGERQSWPHRTLYHPASLRGICLGWQMDGYHAGAKEQIHVTGEWPLLPDGRQNYPREAPSINVGAARSPEVIAKDITRRFLPDYNRLQLEQLEYARQRERHAKLTQESARQIEALGARQANNGRSNDPSSVTLYLGSDNHLYSLTVSGDSVRIEHTSVPLKVALAIIPLCRKEQADEADDE